MAKPGMLEFISAKIDTFSRGGTPVMHSITTTIVKQWIGELGAVEITICYVIAG